MKRKFKALLLPLPALAIVPVAISAGCNQTDMAKLAKESKFIQYVPDERKPIPSFWLDGSANYGGWLNLPEENAATALVRVQSFGRPVYDENKEVYTKTSFWRYKLELASKIIINTKDGKKLEFDSDDYDTNLIPKGENGYKLIQYHAISNNKKSINSSEFDNALKNATKLQLVVREGAKWFKASGEATKYNIVAEDFYISWLRTYYLTQIARKKELMNDFNFTDQQANELEAKLNSILEQSSRYFTKSYKYPNGYLYEVYNINFKNLFDKSKFITKEDGKDAITFDINKQNEKAYFDELFTTLATGQEFSAAPSQYIKDQADKFELKPFQEGSAKKTAAEELTKQIREFAKIKPENPLVTAGIYWYGINWEDVLIGGRYFYKGYDAGAHTDTWSKNENYWDAKSTKTKEYIIKYKDNTDANIFKKQTFDDYRLGSASILNTKNITDADKNWLFINRKNYGSFYSEEYNTNRSTVAELPVIVPNVYAYADGSKADLLKFFNDPFSKLVYGIDRETIVGGKSSGVEFYKNLFAGRGLQFRTLINSAINWEQIANVVSAGNKKSWISGYAPNGKIGAKDSGEKSPIEYYQQISTLYGLNANLEKVAETTPELNEKILEKSNDDAEKMKSAKFEEASKALTELLDKFYAENNLDEKTVKIEWTVPFRYTSFNPVLYKSVFEKQIPELIEKIDKKGRLKPTFKLFTNRDELTEALIRGIGAYQAGGWSNDVNNIGSGIDGLINLTQLHSLICMIGAETTIADALKTAFPEMVKMSKAFITKVHSNTSLTTKLPLNNSASIPLNVLSSFSEYYQHWTVDNGIYKLTEDDIVNFDLVAEFTKFITEYIGQITTNEAINLAKEFSVYIGPVTDRQRTINKTPEISYVNPYVEYPFYGVNATWFSDIAYTNVNDTNSNK